MRVEFTVNGEPVAIDGHPMERLLDVVRERLGATGTKEGCGEGECGACTVLLDGRPVLSCLVPLVQCAGRTVETVEALAAGPARALVERLVATGGVQCGACTPGIVVTAWALLSDHPAPSRDEVREALAGNLCRCTGYEGIVRALAVESEPQAPARPAEAPDRSAGRSSPPAASAASSPARPGRPAPSEAARSATTERLRG